MLISTLLFRASLIIRCAIYRNTFRLIILGMTVSTTLGISQHTVTNLKLYSGDLDMFQATTHALLEPPWESAGTYGIKRTGIA